MTNKLTEIILASLIGVSIGSLVGIRECILKNNNVKHEDKPYKSESSAILTPILPDETYKAWEVRNNEKVKAAYNQKTCFIYYDKEKNEITYIINHPEKKLRKPDRFKPIFVGNYEQLAGLVMKNGGCDNYKLNFKL